MYTYRCILSCSSVYVLLHRNPQGIAWSARNLLEVPTSPRVARKEISFLDVGDHCHGWEMPVAQKMGGISESRNTLVISQFAIEMAHLYIYIVDFLVKDGDFPWQTVSLPGRWDNRWPKWHIHRHVGVPRGKRYGNEIRGHPLHGNGERSGFVLMKWTKDGSKIYQTPQQNHPAVKYHVAYTHHICILDGSSLKFPHVSWPRGCDSKAEARRRNCQQ